MSASLVEAPSPVAPRPLQVAVAAGLGATAMLFAALTSALIVRRSFPDWTSVAARPFLSLGILALLASFSIEWHVRTRFARGVAFRTFLAANLLYLAAAAATIWRVAGSGLGAPQSAFLVLFLGLHALHAAGATIFCVVVLRASGERAESDMEDGGGLARLVTHFITLLLIVILALFVL